MCTENSSRIDYVTESLAARALRMPRSKLSRRIGQLEERLGVRLGTMEDLIETLARADEVIE